MTKESSFKLQQQMERSAGDGEDAAEPSLPEISTPVLLKTPLSEAGGDASSSNSVSVANFFTNAPPNTGIPAVKSLTPYRIEGIHKHNQENKNAHFNAPNMIKRDIKETTVKNECMRKLVNNGEGTLKLKKDDQPALDSSFVTNKVYSLVKSLPTDAIFSPVDAELLNTPPVDLANKIKVAMSPKPPGAPTSKHSTIKYIKVCRKMHNEPKFVPYEPYKCCSSPMKGKPTHTKFVKGDLAKTSEPVLPAVLPGVAVQKTGLAKSRATLDIAVVDFEAEREQWQDEVKIWKGKYEALEQQLQRCQREKTTLEDQLNVQAQVNSELKKLLVASVGEDVQGRMHCLTEDKARMATMIRRYSEKLDRDYEERERMTILCDVWKSKFLASSVLVEELGSWKAALLRWTAEAAEALQALLDEQALLRCHARRGYRLLGELVGAFDPLQAGPDSHVAGLGGDAVSASIAVAAQAQTLHQRLLAPLAAPPPPVVLPDEERTPGEKMAAQVLERRTSCVVYPGYVGSGGSFPLSPTSCVLPSHTTLNCCASCNGEIQLV
ncbi:uncharacterized protein LOC125179059 isoform X3 [Hyalella azteca]|uniref:Uncharacterized protein LOC125179059 isoform X3 n=1 Tax=Hyalella azteca TaxID=294128 RepID=A0A979FSI5_HYAAZ|nr:uncharacterized protein LOC125179059 isoform X3 [Hyalella azteca]